VGQFKRRRKVKGVVVVRIRRTKEEKRKLFHRIPTADKYLEKGRDKKTGKKVRIMSQNRKSFQE